MNKRESLLSLVQGNPRTEGVPAGFFLHFDSKHHFGQAAVDKHMEYFRYTGMDFVKIQYERNYPYLPDIKKPEDWARIPFYGLDYYADQLGVVAGLVKAAKSEAMVLLTLYSPFMCAIHTVGEGMLIDHLQQNPEAVKKGLRIIADSLMGFVREAIKLGIDGFYHSTMGGEDGRFNDPDIFTHYIRPLDLELMTEIDHQCSFNILHICDYLKRYRDLTQFVDYPGHVVNTNLQLVDRMATGQEISVLFGRPFMGGLDRNGIIVNGSLGEIRQETTRVLEAAPARFILGADCTVPSDIDWDHLRTAIDTAHQWKSYR